MTTYSVREFKAKASEILRNLKDGDEIVITRRGLPCGKLIPMQSSVESKGSLRDLRGSMTSLPEATYEDFLDIKSIWEPRTPASGENNQ